MKSIREAYLKDSSILKAVKLSYRNVTWKGIGL